MATGRIEKIRERIGQIEFDFDEEALCDHSRVFKEWVDEWLFPEIVKEAIEGEDVKKAILILHKAILMLVMKYFSYEGAVPKTHWNCRSDRAQHVCLWHIFYKTYRRLEALLNGKRPPQYYEPPKAIRPSVFNRNTLLGWLEEVA